MPQVFKSLMTFLLCREVCINGEFLNCMSFSGCPGDMAAVVNRAGLSRHSRGTAEAHRLLFGGRHGGWTASAGEIEQMQIAPPPWLQRPSCQPANQVPGGQTVVALQMQATVVANV